MYGNAPDMLWKALLSEFLATLILVMVAIIAVISIPTTGLSPVGAALVYGLTFAGLYYIFSMRSGSHLNPFVSLGFALAGRMNWGLMLGYWIAQILGGIAAAALAVWFFGSDSGVGASIGTLTTSNVGAAVVLTAILTFLLVLVFLFVTASPMFAVVAGLVIGFVLAAIVIAGYQGVGAGATNFAWAFGSAIFSNNLGSIWIYIVGPLLGALVAALVYKLFTVDFSCCDKVDENGCKVLDECGNPIKVCRRPVVDNCGNALTDCDGVITEQYVKHDRKLGHYQETYATAIGGWMHSHGVDPLYVKQEFDHAVQSVMPNGVMEQPRAVVDAVITPIAGLSVPAGGSYAGSAVTDLARTSPLIAPPSAFANSMSGTVQPVYRLPTVVQPL
jgi:aquaporin Z